MYNMLKLGAHTGQLLHAQFVRQILRDTKKRLEALPNIVPITLASTTANSPLQTQAQQQAHTSSPTVVSPTPVLLPRLTVIGDLHGQLKDLLHIFREHGTPSPENPYLFNGDLVDRGAQGVEVALLIFAYQLLYPDHVHVTRGNHEERSINLVYGFLKECATKYDQKVCQW
jgi:hypothetical protein